MDGRRLLSLVLISSVASMGCSLFQKKSPPTGFPPSAPVVEEKTVKGPMKNDTLVAYADTFRANALNESNTPLQKEEIQNNARKFYQEVLQRDPKNIGALRGLAMLYANMGVADKGVETYRKALQVSPNDPELWLGVASIQSKYSRDYQAALESVSQAVRLDPENVKYRRWQGRTLAAAGRPDEAIAILGRLMPEAEARLEIAQTLYHTGQMEASQVQLQLVLQKDPGNVVAREVLTELNGGGPPEQISPSSANPVQPVRYEQPATPTPVNRATPNNLPASITKPASEPVGLSEGNYSVPAPMLLK